MHALEQGRTEEGAENSAKLIKHYTMLAKVSFRHVF